MTLNKVCCKDEARKCTKPGQKEQNGKDDSVFLADTGILNEDAVSGKTDATE